MLLVCVVIYLKSLLQLRYKLKVKTFAGASYSMQQATFLQLQ